MGGYTINEAEWEKVNNKSYEENFYIIDDYKRKLGFRFVSRKKLGLFPNTSPCFLPKFGQCLSFSFLPPKN